MRIGWITAVAALAAATTGHTDYQNWLVKIGMYNDYPHGYSDYTTFLGVEEGAHDLYDSADDPDTLMKVWAVEVHAPNVGYTWRLRWQINQEPGFWIPDPPFAIRIRPNETFPEGLDLTANGAGYFWVTGLAQWGPEARIWLIEAGIVPEPALTWLAAGVPVLIRLLLRRRS